MVVSRKRKHFLSEMHFPLGGQSDTNSARFLREQLPLTPLLSLDSDPGSEGRGRDADIFRAKFRAV